MVSGYEPSVDSSKGDSSSISDLPLGRITYSGESNEYIIIGNRKYERSELASAFGGSLNAGLTPIQTYFGNPAPLGLSAFAMTTFVLSLYNAGAMGISVPNVVIGLSVFYGGAVQFLCGAWELLIGNTFGGTALTSYGAFWFSYSTLFLDSFGIAEAYADDEEMLANAIGFFLLGWVLFTFMLVLATMKSTVAFFSLFLLLDITFILLAAGEFTGKPSVKTAGGVTGVITAFIAWYNAFAGVANKQNSYFTAYSIPLTGK